MHAAPYFPEAHGRQLLALLSRVYWPGGHGDPDGDVMPKPQYEPGAANARNEQQDPDGGEHGARPRDAHMHWHARTKYPRHSTVSGTGKHTYDLDDVQHLANAAMPGATHFTSVSPPFWHCKTALASTYLRHTVRCTHSSSRRRCSRICRLHTAGTTSRWRWRSCRAGTACR